MTDRREFGVLLALLVLAGAGRGLSQPLDKIAVSEGHRHFGLIFWQLVIGAALLGLIVALRGRRMPLRRPQFAVAAAVAVVLWSLALLGENYSGYVWAAPAAMFAGLALVQPRPPLAALAGPGEGTVRRLDETP